METYQENASLNRNLPLSDLNADNTCRKPSVYITKVKLRRAVREMPDRHIEDLFDNEMTPAGIKAHRDKLNKKVDRLLYWQLMTALNVLLRDGNYDAIEFVLKCKRTDREIN